MGDYLFEIMILIFIFYPAIKRFLDKMKQKSQAPQRQDSPYQEHAPEKRHPEAAEPVWTEEPVDWDDAFREIEELFTGNKSEPAELEPHPREPQPLPRRNPYEELQRQREEEIRQINQQHHQPSQAVSENPYSYTDFKRGNFEDPADLVDEGNPIFQDIDTPVQVVIHARYSDIAIHKSLRDPDTLRKAIIIKEVLTPPMSVRKSAGNYGRYIPS